MDAASDRPEFEPPRQEAMGRGLVLALVAHALLFAGLASGLKWQRDSQTAAVEAELWAAVPQEAAPAPPPPPPPPPPAPPAPAPVPAPPPVVKPPPEPQVQREAQIAQEREKKREAEEKKREELEREREERRKLEAKKKREEELAKKKEEAKLAEAKRKEEEKKRKEQEAKEAREAARVAKQREENLRRMQGMAGSGAPSATGTAAKASGPSAGWGAKVNAKVRPHIVFADPVDGNPKAEVEVRTAPDGTIVARKLVRSSGVKSWDEAVLRALDKAETLPRDVDGRVPSPVVIEFRPKG